jgi:hypothetical protein
MNTTKIIVTTLLGFIINAASAQNFSADIGYVSDYFYRGSLKSEEAIQSSIGFNSEAGGLGFSGSAFTNQSVDVGLDSYQLALGVSKSFADDLVTAYGGLNHFEDGDGEALLEAAISLSANVLLSPTLNLYRSIEGDDLFTWEVGVNYKFDLDVVELCVHGLYGETDLTSSLDSDYYLIGTQVSKSISDSANLLVGADFINSDLAEREWVFSTAVSINF